MSDTKMDDAGKKGAPPAARDREFGVKERSQLQQVVRRFVRHKLAMTSLIGFVFLILLCFVGAELWTYKPDNIDSPSNLPPSLDHPFGTDPLGHDVFAQVLRGGQQSIKVALLVVLITTGIGAPWGAISAFYSGRVDASMMRVVDIIMTLPFYAMAGALSVIFGGSWWLVALIIGFIGWVVDARVVRGVVLSLREQEFVEAARALGASDSRIVFRHLLPNAAGPIIVQATLNIATAILAEAALSFVGLGILPPDTSLGVLTANARDQVQNLPWTFYFPGAMIIAIALCINFIGDGLRDALDPRQTRQRR